MQKFFIKAITFIVGISLIFNFLGTFADRIAPLEDWRVEHQQRVADLQVRSDRIKAITLGNSHSDAIDYSVLFLRLTGASDADDGAGAPLVGAAGEGGQA
jgi:hypothetical protein